MRVISKSWSLIRIPVLCGCVRSKTYAGDTTEYTTIVPVTKFGDPGRALGLGERGEAGNKDGGGQKDVLVRHD